MPGFNDYPQASLPLNDADVVLVLQSDVLKQTSKENLVRNTTVDASVITVAGMASTITNVNSNLGIIGTVNTNISNINTVAGLSAKITTLAGISSAITAVSNISSNVSAVAGDLTNIDSVASNLSGINTAASMSTAITTVNSNSTNINSVASNSTNINSVANMATNIGTVAGLSSAITTVNSNASNINSVASNAANITTVAGMSSAISTVNGNSTNINTVSTNITAINSVASSLDFIESAPTYAAQAQAAAANLVGLSTTSLTIGTGSITLTTQSGKQFNLGQYVQVVSNGNPANTMFGLITSYSGNTLVFNCTATTGSGTSASWTIYIAGAPGIQGPAGSVSSSTTTLFTAQQNFGAQALTSGTTIAWNLNSQQVATLLIDTNATLSNPTNMVNGGTYILIITQDATGSRTLAYGSAYKFPGGVKPVLTTAADFVDVLTFISDGTNMYGVAQKAFS